MKLLLSDRFKVALHLGEANEPTALTVYLMDLSGKERVEALKSKHVFANEVYDAIKTASTVFQSNGDRSLYHVLLIHIDQYKNNLYGIHLKNRSVDGVGGISIFVEEYVRRFAIEISACFESCSATDQTALTRKIEQEIINSGPDYEDALELRKLLDIWKESRSGSSPS